MVIDSEPTFQVPARGDDAASNMQWSDVHADELRADDIDYMDPNEAALAMEWLVAIERANCAVADVVCCHNGEARPETVRECLRDAAE
jgi:hypothetical protein